MKTSAQTIASIVLLVIVIGGAALLIDVIFEQKITVVKQQKELDSLHTYFRTLDVMQKTLSVAYPYISKYEAKYYAYMFYDLSFSYKIDWSWYPATIRSESNWNQCALSKSKARGLTQMVPICAKSQADRLNMDYEEGFTEWNEINNIIMGMDYLSQGFVKGDTFAIKRYIGGAGYRLAADTFQTIISKYAADVQAEQKKVDSIFQEHEKVSYIYKGVQYDTQTKKK